VDTLAWGDEYDEPADTLAWGDEYDEPADTLAGAAEGEAEGAAEGAPPAAIDFSHARAVVSATLDAADVSEVVAAAAWFLLSHEEVYKWPDWRKVCVPLSLDASQACLLTAPSGCMHLLTAPSGWMHLLTAHPLATRVSTLPRSSARASARSLGRSHGGCLEQRVVT
jgi:hypothetical protein